MIKIETPEVLERVIHSYELLEEYDSTNPLLPLIKISSDGKSFERTPEYIGKFHEEIRISDVQGYMIYNSMLNKAISEYRNNLFS